MARVLDFLPTRERSETSNSDIDSNRLPGLRQWLRFRYLAYNKRIPSIRATFDPNLIAFPFKRAGEPDATSPDPGNLEFVAFGRARPHILVFMRETVISVFALKSRKARLRDKPFEITFYPRQNLVGYDV